VERHVEHPDGRRIPLKANISVPNSEALTRFVMKTRPNLVIEIGMAYGISTLSILLGLQENGEGRLISIDPYAGWPTGRAVALHQVARAGLSGRHEHLHECSYEALPRLLAQNLKPDFIYIDGDHAFATVFVDFFYSDKMLPPGGVVGFNDAGWRSVHAVIRAVKKLRNYQELDIGLPRVFRARNPVFSLIKRLEGRSTYDRYFKKLSG
jgi:predicted O-methyltransferase YrrM